MAQRIKFSIFKFMVGFALLYYGLKALHILPIEIINFIEGVIGGILGNLWGLILVFIGIIILFGSIYSRSRVNTRFYRTWGTLSNDDDEDKEN